MDRAYDLYLLGENVSYVVPATLGIQKNLIVPSEEIRHLQEVLEYNRSHNDRIGITSEEASKILDWICNKTWQYLSHFGIDMTRNSLNGFCEVAQLCSLYPLEQVGLKVTKNTAENSFDICFITLLGQ